MSFEYNGFIHRDLEPQVRYDAEQVELLKQADQKIYETISTLPLGGEKVSLTFPAGASEGTITADQLTTLQASDANYIEMVNDKELYYLNDNGHTEGFLTYSHVGIENSKATIKTLTITISAKSFVIVTTVVPTDAGGGKLYKHDIAFTVNISESEIKYAYFTLYSTSHENYTFYSLLSLLDKFNNNCANGIVDHYSKLVSTYYVLYKIEAVNLESIKRINFKGYNDGASTQKIDVQVDNTTTLTDTVTEL